MIAFRSANYCDAFLFFAALCVAFFLVSSHSVLAQDDSVALRAAKMQSVDVRFEDSITTQKTFRVGDRVTVVGNAGDPKGLPLQYSFRHYRGGGFAGVLQDWSEKNSVTYEFTEKDAGLGYNYITVCVRNNDNVDAQSEERGDDTSMDRASFYVDNGTRPAKMQSVDVRFEDSITTQKTFRVGDRVTVVGNAGDPKGLPLQYSFRHYRGGGFAGVLQDWSEKNSVTYEFTEKDAGLGYNYITVCVRNNDNVDAQSEERGDDTSMDRASFYVQRRQE